MTRAELFKRRKKIEAEQARRIVMGSNYNPTPNSGFSYGDDLLQLLMENIQAIDVLEPESSFSCDTNTDPDTTCIPDSITSDSGSFSSD